MKNAKNNKLVKGMTIITWIALQGGKQPIKNINFSAYMIVNLV